ncbi:GIY-YIG nuclease family protein [Bacillus toyonensis]|uniref:GIY-YIG nuclease family protein n=1 Tax=Bacillus toyonensis TaxID=155322 RepID=UPI001C54F942|nr:GIY-YIG nuclease family protein [Bacillus toyonensis]
MKKESNNIKVKVNCDTIPSTRENYGYEITIKINKVEEYEWHKEDADFIYKLPSDKYGVYIVYSEKECIYVGETTMNGGFQHRFKKHHYLQEFLVEARRVVLYEMDQERNNERILLEKIKIKELNPILNRAEKKEKSLELSKDVANKIQSLTEDLLEAFDYYSAKLVKSKDNEIQKVDAQVGKKFRQVYRLLEKIKLPISSSENLTALFENGVNPIYFLPNIINCPQCSGEPCDICNSTSQLIMINGDPCKTCGSNGFVNKDYCEECKGTGIEEFKPFNENEIKNRSWESCSSCGGTGETLDEETCPDCKGMKIICL